MQTLESRSYKLSQQWSNCADICQFLQDDGTFGEDADGGGLAASPGSVSLGEDSSEDEDDEDGDAAEHRMNVRTGQPSSKPQLVTENECFSCIKTFGTSELSEAGMALHIRNAFMYARGPGACCQPHTLLFNTDSCGTCDMLAAAGFPHSRKACCRSQAPLNFLPQIECAHNL